MKERKGKMVILITIFFIITNLVLAGFTIQNASKNAADSARKKLGTDVTLDVDTDKLREKVLKGENPTPPQLDLAEAEKLAKSNYVKDYNYISNTFGIPEGFKLVGDSENGEEKQTIGSTKPGASGMDMNSSFMIEGVRKNVLHESFKNGKSKIVDGKPITEKMKDQNVIVMEQRLAEQNNLKVGDKVKIQTGDKKQTHEFELIGIYKTEEQAPSLGMGNIPPMLEPANKLYMPHSTVKKLDTDQAAGNKVVYDLNDPQYINAFKKEANQFDIDLNYFKLDAHDKLYKQMVGPIENIASISQMIVYIVSLAGVVILGLITILFIKERRKELGILLSIGEKKWKLVGQLVVEVLCVGILAFGLSLTTGEKVSQTIGNTLLSSEIESTKEEDATDSMVMSIGSGQNEQKRDPIESIDVSMTTGDIGKVGGVGLGIGILTTILPALSILRLNPKQILLKDE